MSGPAPGADHTPEERARNLKQFADDVEKAIATVLACGEMLEDGAIGGVSDEQREHMLNCFGTTLGFMQAVHRECWKGIDQQQPESRIIRPD